MHSRMCSVGKGGLVQEALRRDCGMSSYCSDRSASRETVNARPVPHGTHRLLGQTCPHEYCPRVFALHATSLGWIEEGSFQGGSPRTSSFSLPSPPDHWEGGQLCPSLYFPSQVCAQCSRLPHPQCIITSFCIWLPTGSVHGKPRALAAAQSTALLLILGRWFFSPPPFQSKSATLMILFIQKN